MRFFMIDDMGVRVMSQGKWHANSMCSRALIANWIGKEFQPEPDHGSLI